MATWQPEKFQDTFFALIEQKPGCWRWLGTKDPNGYSRYGNGDYTDGTTLVHRIAYRLVIGDIPEGHDLDHVCHSDSACTKGRRCPHRGCPNPHHLEPVTHYVNMRRGSQANQTHCKHGHELSGDNLVIRERNNGKGHTYRQCRACLRIRAKEASQSASAAR